MTGEAGNDKEQRNVIMLWNYLNWGGAQIYFLSIVKHAPKNWKFKIVVPRDSPDDILDLFKKHGAEIEFQDVLPANIFASNPVQKLKRKWRRIHSEIETYKYIKRQNMKNAVLHIETAPWNSRLFIKKLAAETDVFVTMHNSLPPVSKLREFIFKSRLKNLSELKTFHLFTSNQDTKNSLKGWFTDKFWNRIKVTYTCVDPSEIDEVLRLKNQKNDLKKNFSVEKEKFVVLCAGQFIDRKGRREFLEAARELLKTDKNLQFLWLTQSDLNDEDERLIESFDLRDSFKIIKSKSVGKTRHEILSFFQIADIFALPSHVEGLPIALLEAMSLGIPSISTNINAIPEAVRNHDTGILIGAGKSDELVRAIKRLKSDPFLRAKLSERGKDFVVENFDERVCAKIVLESYENAIQSRKNRV